VFAGFLLDGRWLQHFGIRAKALREDILPTTTVLVEGRKEPAPADPEATLVAIYGDGWRTPDPSFTFDLPSSTADRFYGWWGDYNVEREDWDDVVLLAPPDTPAGDGHLSAFAGTVHDRTPVGTGVLELGCGI